MKEYLEFNNIDKTLAMICVSEKGKTLHYSSTGIRRACMGLPIIHQFKNFKNAKISLSEILKTCSIRKLAEPGPLDLSSNSKYFKIVRNYNRRHNE